MQLPPTSSGQSKSTAPLQLHTKWSQRQRITTATGRQDTVHTTDSTEIAFCSTSTLQWNLSTRRMHGIVWDGSCIALQAWHVQCLQQQSAASDCNQERQHTLAYRCSLSSAVSSALCCLSRSLLLRRLSYRTASAQALGGWKIH